MNVTMPHPFKTAKHLFLGAALCGLVGVICFFGGRLSAGGGAESPQLDAVVLESRLEDIRELATVTYAYTNMAQFESSNDFYGVKVPFTTKSFILTYDGTIKAGMDLKDADLQLSGTTLTVHLPQAVILSHEIDEGSVEVFDEKPPFSTPLPWRISPPSRPIKRPPWRKKPSPGDCCRRPVPREKPPSAGFGDRPAGRDRPEVYIKSTSKKNLGAHPLFRDARPGFHRCRRRPFRALRPCRPRVHLFRQDPCLQLLRCVRQAIRAGRGQLFPLPKAPGDTADPKARIVRRLHVHIAVPHKQRPRRRGPQLFHNTAHAGRVRLHRHLRPAYPAPGQTDLGNSGG